MITHTRFSAWITVTELVTDEGRTLPIGVKEDQRVRVSQGVGVSQVLRADHVAWGTVREYQKEIPAASGSQP